MRLWDKMLSVRRNGRHAPFSPLGWTRPLAVVLAFGAITAGMVSHARAETVEIYSAGSLKSVVEALAKAAGPLEGVDIKPTFGPAGSLRERIEGGDRPDLFLSADMGSPRKLVEEGRTIMPAVAFAQNRMCLIARRSIGVTTDNLVDRMLAKGNRLKASPPIVDPGGDYAVAIFDRIEALHKGAGQILREKAQRATEETKSAQPLAGHSPAASLFLNNQIDMMIGYCSGAPAIEKEAPGVVALAFPPALEPRPVDGMVVLSAKPGALRLALYLMSEKGQEIIKAAGLLPILSPLQ
jgi:molybdate transport system substrate-binding protein